MASRPSTAKLLVFAMIPALVLLVLAEGIVRFFRLDEGCPAPAYAKSPLWVCDPLLQFRLNPSLWVDGGLNSRGLRGPEYDPGAPYRILALGDSCTFGMGEGVSIIEAPYPKRLNDLAQQHWPGRVNVLNAGVPGYTSYHGVMLLRTRLRQLRPNLITVKYGWNDLLISLEHGVSSFEEPQSAWARAGEDLLLRTALYPFALKLGRTWHQRSQATAAPAFVVPATWTPNVDIDLYKRHLRRIVELGHRRGAEVWLLTSADAFITDEYRGREDAYSTTAAQQLGLIRFGGIRSFRELSAIHTRYNDAMREVGAELGAPVVDMEGVYRAHAAEHLFTPLDAIHSNERGHALEAEALFERLQRELAAGGGAR
jgi:lysophospholipase L1-like esterase